ncbi:wax ester/triacylglycerol synthase family O-acyltransferase [Halopseudomonas salina]|uniref:diacylglycerol O-acyltransferase n=1 Tax=Halopseudomonas salina TaxID=1323744 RepID=A0ABQ1PQR3_9GAMM|nr:wax ester/triacylglycerol synthase family O-acyltransferase [Halopseudomonas salina]GGD01130.1 diacylglycerol O-acyltransferase [Halopseudomonas salina]
MKQLTPMDSHFYYFEAPNQPMMIGSLWLCDQSTAPDGIVRHKEILQYISDRLNTTSYFRRRLEQAPFQLDDPYWLEDENFDLEYHVRHVGLPQPGDWRQLCIFTARTMSRSVDMERAPWEVYIIEGVNNVEGVPPNSFAVLIRFHHAYVDGKSSLELSTALMEETSAHEYGRRDRVEVAERAPTRMEMWARTAPRMVGQTFRSMKAGFNFSRKSLELANRFRKEGLPEQRRVPKTIFNTAVSPHRSYGAYTWIIPELKRMRQLHKGASLNDVLLAIIAGGMRRYLAKHNQLPEKDSLVSMCPVSIRPEDSKVEGGNLISAMYIAIGTNMADPVERLQAVQARTARGIPIAKEILCELSNSAGDMMPPAMRALGAWVQNKTHVTSAVPLINTVITNVPGIPGNTTRYFAGAAIREVFPLVPVCDGMAISHGMTGIYERLNLGVVADRGVVPDMDFYIQCMKESTEEYLQATEALEARAYEAAASQVQAAKAAEKNQLATPAKADGLPKVKAKSATKAATKPAAKTPASGKPKATRKKAAPNPIAQTADPAVEPPVKKRLEAVPTSSAASSKAAQALVVEPSSSQTEQRKQDGS